MKARIFDLQPSLILAAAKAQARRPATGAPTYEDATQSIRNARLHPIAVTKRLFREVAKRIHPICCVLASGARLGSWAEASRISGRR